MASLQQACHFFLMAEGKRFRLKLAAWSAVVLVLALSGWLFHAPLLKAIGCILIVDQSQDAVTHICLHGNEYSGDGDGYFDKAAKRYQQDPRLGILIIEPKSTRLVQTGILPSFVAMSRRELTARGVPEKVILAIPGEAPDVWQEAHHLGDWLQNHPEAQVQLLCNRFRSRYIRFILNATLEPAIAARVRLAALPDRRYDENNWWQNRFGVKAFVFNFLLATYAKFHGEPNE